MYLLCLRVKSQCATDTDTKTSFVTALCTKKVILCVWSATLDTVPASEVFVLVYRYIMKTNEVYYIFHRGSPLLFSVSRISNIICTAMNKHTVTVTKNFKPGREKESVRWKSRCNGVGCLYVPSAVPKIWFSISIMPSTPTQNPTKLAIIIIRILATAPRPQTNR